MGNATIRGAAPTAALGAVIVAGAAEAQGPPQLFTNPIYLPNALVTDSAIAILP
jgi:hypothetical protein